MTYEMNVVYVWQNQVGDMACLNNTECMVTGPVETYYARRLPWRGQPTDSRLPSRSSQVVVMAWEGDLRRKRLPANEESIIRMFGLTAPAPREVEAA